MSLPMIWAICIFGCDLAIYILLKRIYGEKYRRLSPDPTRKPPH